ncbi:MAG: DUF433 domain-containing protein [Fimbriimonadales bacterium]|nr:DUF433 domain-containing protein [Fimbriimonadales bacterium]
MPALRSLPKLRLPSLPVQEDEHGVPRIAGTRIPLETVLLEFRSGKSPEAIVEQFPVLRLEDVYTIGAYYMANRETMDAYLQRIEREIEETAQAIESQFGNKAFLQKLRKRRK